jgi:membrane protease YdiL (CAAX protease family)
MSDFPDETPMYDNDEVMEEVPPDEPKRESYYRGGNADPAFGFLLAIAVSIGLIPILPENADLRYTLAWGALAIVGVLSWLLGNADRIGQEKPENIIWGVGLGMMVSVPFVIFFREIFGTAAMLMFPSHDGATTTLGNGTVLAYLVFVMPLAETLFFRGLLQRRLEFWIVGALGGLWSVILFFPVMWAEVLENPAVGAFLAIALFAIYMMYSYVRERNGLAAAWIAQIVACLILFFAPFVAR